MVGVRGRDVIFVYLVAARTSTLTLIHPHACTNTIIPFHFPQRLLKHFLSTLSYRSQTYGERSYRVSDFRKEHYGTAILALSQQVGYGWAVDKDTGAGYLHLCGLRVRRCLRRRVQATIIACFEYTSAFLIVPVAAAMVVVRCCSFILSLADCPYTPSFLDIQSALTHVDDERGSYSLVRRQLTYL